MKKEWIIFKSESFLESLLADITTFAFLLLCIWFSQSQGGGWWTFFTCSMFLFWISAKAAKGVGLKTRVLKTKKEALEWAESLPDDLKG